MNGWQGVGNKGSMRGKEWGWGREYTRDAALSSSDQVSCGHQRTQVVFLGQKFMVFVYTWSHGLFVFFVPLSLFFSSHSVFLPFPSLLLSFKAQSKSFPSQPTGYDKVRWDAKTESILYWLLWWPEPWNLLNILHLPNFPQHSEIDSLCGEEEGDCPDKNVLSGSWSLSPTGKKGIFQNSNFSWSWNLFLQIKAFTSLFLGPLNQS